MNEDIRDDVQLVMQHIYNTTNGEDEQPQGSEEDIIHVHHYPDADLVELPNGTVIFKKNESTTTHVPIVESNPQNSQAKQPPMTIAYATVSMYLFLILSCLVFQIYILANPFTVNVTLDAREQQVTLTGTLQLGRVLSPITLTQSQTVPTTGRGHQDARAATGYVTFYNGQFNQVTIAAGMILTGNDGIQIATDQDIAIPGVDTSATPPTLGQVTVSAHVTNSGSRGNIAAYDINQSCCATSILVKNTAPFHGGQDERDFQIVTKTDITNAAIPLKANLAQSAQGGLTGQLKTNEGLVTPSCTTTTNASNQLGQEATQVTVTISETCSAVAYNQDSLQAKVTQLLATQAAKKLGSGYSILGNPHINVTSATVSKQVMLSFSGVSTWIYALTTQEQQSLKKIIAGKTKEQAMQLLSSLPGVESASMQSSSFGDATRIPKNLSNIHLMIFYSISSS